LEENLWAHYNYETGLNLSSLVKPNELLALFRERSDSGALDLEMGQLAAYWRECADKDRKGIIENLRQLVVKDMEAASSMQSSSQQDHQQAGGSSASQAFKSKVMQAKSGGSGMSYQLSVKEKVQQTSNIAIQEQANKELRTIIEFAMRNGNEFEMIGSLIYTALDRFQL
jgi:hypothetical protein